MPLTAKRVLCVGENKDTCELITTWLTLEGFEVVTAGDNAEAVERASRERFDLVVIDEPSRAVAALELCRTLRARAPSTLALLISASHYEPTREQAMKAGAQELLVHDGDGGKLKEAVRRLIDFPAD
jgi:CheY-like chemotaxis protein